MQNITAPALVPYTSTLRPADIARILIRWTPDGPERAGHDYVPVDSELPGFATPAEIGTAISTLRAAAAEHQAPIRVDVLAELRDAGTPSEIAANAASMTRRGTGRPVGLVRLPDADARPAGGFNDHTEGGSWTPPAAPVSREWGQQVVDAAGAERAARDEATAKEYGLALPPAFFALGTTLVQVGVDKARAERHAFERLPAADAAMRDLAAQVKAEQRRDLAVGLAKIKVNANGKLVVPIADDEGERVACIGVEREAMSRLSSILRSEVEAPGDLGIVTALSYKSAPNIIRNGAALWNNYAAEVARREETASERKSVVLRTRVVADKGGATRTQAYAVVSESYAEVDVHRVAEAIGRLPNIGLCRAQVFYDGRRAGIDVITQTTVAPEDQTVGDMHRLVLRVQTNDTGGGSLRVYPIAERIACINRTLIDVKGAELIIRHVGETGVLVEKLREGLRNAHRVVDVFARQWEKAVKPLDAREVEASEKKQRDDFAEMVERFQRDSDLAAGRALMDGVYRSLLAHQDLVAVRKVEDTLPQLRAAHFDPRNAMPGRDRVVGGLSRASIANGLTLWAQSLTTDAAHQVEALAGRVVSGDLPLTWLAAPAA